jgi:hypothetical protein
MANGKNIEIRIAATGADQAAREVEKIPDAIKEVTEAQQELNEARQEAKGFGGMLDGTTPRTDERAASNEREKKSVEELTTATDDLRESTDKLEEVNEQAAQASDVRTIKKVALAQVLNLAAGAAAEMGEKIRGAAEDLRAFDPDSSAKLATVASGFDAVSSSARGAAIGMVALGPPGAAIGAIVAPAFGELSKEVQGAYESFLNLKEIEQIAADLPARMEAVRRATLVREQVDSWKSLVNEMRSAGAEADSLARVDAVLRRSNERFAENDLRRAEAIGDTDQVASAEAALKLLREQNALAEQTASTAAAQRAVETASTEFFGAMKALTLTYQQEATKETAAEQARLAEEVAKYRVALQEAERRLRETQAIGGIESETRQNDRQADAAIEIVRVGEDVTRAALDAIEQIKNTAASEGRAPSAIESETIGRIQGLVNDTTPDAQQGGQLAGILQTLSNNITAKDENLQTAVDGMIRNVGSIADRYENIINRVESLEDRINQLQ